MNKTHNPYGIAQIEISDWDVLGYFYQGTSMDMATSYNLDMIELDRELFHVTGNVDADDNWALIKTHANGGCASCGTHFAHGVVVHNRVTSDIISIGGICSQMWGTAQQIGMRQARAQRAAANGRKAIAAKIAAEKTLSDNPGLGDAFETKHFIIEDIERKMWQYGTLSQAQIELIFKIARDTEERNILIAEREAQLAEAPKLEEGRYEITGTIVSTKFQSSPYSYDDILKMLVELDTGNRVWGSVPKSIWDDAEKDVRISFHAAVKQSNDDVHFGFFSRPTKAVVVEEVTT